MANTKINKSEFINGIQNIINEGFDADQDKVVDYRSKFNISRYVAGLFESGQRNPKLMTYLNSYNNLLSSNDVKEFMVYEQFGQGLAQYASGNKDVKDVIREMNETLYEYGRELEVYRLIESIQDPAAQVAVRDAYDHYITNEDAASHSILVDAIDVLGQLQDPVAPQLTILITNDSTSRLPQIEMGTTETRFDEIQRKIKEEKARKQMEAVKAQVDEYARQIFDEAEAAKRAECEACTFESIVNNNGLNLRESIKNIVSSDAKTNKKLMETIEQYAGALNQGLYEERLYEGFVQNISKYNYLLPVAKEIKRINEAAIENASSIIVTKILEEMTTTPSYYIIPIIEEDAVRYVKEPSAINRVQLRNALCSFAGDPYCHAMLEAIERDNAAIAKTLDEKALSFKDHIKMIRENANVEAIYSPVQYIKENECVFNANGQFFVKKGNTLAKLSNEYLNQLSEGFIALCQLVNDPRVTINDNDTITLIGSDKVATIYEGYVEINGCKETTDTLRNLNEMCIKYDFDTNFFVMASCLHEHFNDIAVINFGKHISLNENAGINVDMFRCGNNIFINCVNETVDKSTFYHNVNPIQCRNIINKHMGINVASLFEDLLPSQEKIMLKLNETKNEYEASIEKYEDAIEKLQKAKEDCTSEDNEAKLDGAIEDTQKKLDDLKAEYAEWQKDVDNTTDGESQADNAEEPAEEEDPNTDVEKSSEPIDDAEVDNAKPELMQPLNGAPVDAEEDPTISDEEFDSYLDGEEAPVEGEAEVPAEGEVAEDEVAEEPAEGEVVLSEAEPEVELGDAEEPVAGDDEEAFQEVELGDAEEPVEELPAEEPAVEEPAEETIDFDDEEPVENELPAEEDVVEDIEEVAVPEGYKITNVVFDQNLKTGKLFKTGTVSVVCPMISSEGKMYVQSNDYHFYIDEESHLPICDAADIPVALYNAIVATIQEDPEFSRADSEGEALENKEQDETFYSAEDIKAASDELEANDDEAIFDFTESPEGDSITISAKEPVDEPVAEEPAEELNIRSIFDDAEGDEVVAEPVVEEPAAEVAPSYKDGETEIELPAPNVDGTEIPEISAEEAAEVADAAEEDDFDIAKIFNDAAAELEDEPSDEPAESEEIIDFDMDEEPAAESAEIVADDEHDFPAYDEVEIDEEPAEAPEGDEVEEALQAAEVAIKNAQDKLNLKKDPEVMKNTVSESVNENRKNLVSLSAIIKKNGKDFFLSEGTIKPSKKEDAHVNETFDGVNLSDEAPMNEPIEDYNENYDSNILEVMQRSALKRAEAAAPYGDQIFISPVLDRNNISYFNIVNQKTKDGYTVYEYNNKIYYRILSEFENVMLDIANDVYPESILSSDYADPTEEIDYIELSDQDGLRDLIDTIFSCMGSANHIQENIVVRRPELSANGDIDDTKFADDILYGDENKRIFAEKVEKETQKAGVDNPLAPLQPQEAQESVKILPNAHSLIESTLNEKKEDEDEIIYEPMDWVIIKENGMKAQVIAVVNDDEGKLSMLTILASNGITYDCDDLSEIEPDPAYLANMPGRVVNSQLLTVPRLGEFDIDPKTRMPKPVENEKPAEDLHMDLNGKRVKVYVLANGMRLTAEPYYAAVEDIKESKKDIRVINESGEVALYDAKDNVEFVEKPYAVVVDSEGKPIRSIQIDPMSYIEAEEDGLVDCEVDGKETKFPKKCINVLS